MKKKNLGLFLLPALILVGCGKDDIPDIPTSGDGTPSASGNINHNSPLDYFDNYDNQTPHNRLKEIADANDGFILDFNVYQKVNDEVTLDNHLFLGRKGNTVWAENTLVTMKPNNTGLELPYTIKGAVEYKDDGFDVYYAENSDPYTYYGTAYNEDLDFSVEEVESYFALSDALFLALLSQEKATLVTNANRTCFNFSMDNITLTGESVAHSHLNISFDSKTRLIMYYNYFSINADANVEMTVLQVNAFNFSVTPPTLNK